MVMDVKNTISSTEARQKFAEVISNINRTGALYTLTVNGKPRVVMMNAEDFDGWMETMDILSEPGALERIKKAEKEFDRGEYITLEELEKSLNIAK